MLTNLASTSIGKKPQLITFLNLNFSPMLIFSVLRYVLFLSRPDIARFAKSRVHPKIRQND